MRLSMLVSRYWSLALAITLPLLDLFCEQLTRSFGGYDEVVRIFLSAICVALLVHSWFMQRKYARSRWRLAFLTLLLSLLFIGPLWLGLNVIRGESYDLAADYERNVHLWYHNLYWYVVELQDLLVQLAIVLGAALALWLIVDLARWLFAYMKRKPGPESL